MSQGLADWKSYVDFVSNIVISGLAKVASVSLGYMCEQLDAGIMQRESRSPLLEIDLDLCVDPPPSVGSARFACCQESHPARLC